MKYLILLRHAKSSWQNLSLPDHDRPLNKRGRRTAPIMGQRLSLKAIQPQLIISSTAKRALKTAKIVADEIDYSIHEIKTDSRLFHAMPEQMCQVVSECNNEIDSVMLVAHNPGITYFANQLLNTPTFENIPTAGLVTFSVDIEYWSDVLESSVSEKIKLLDYDYPKLIN